MRRKTIILCFSWPIVRRALISAAIVGTILTIINHGDAILHGQVDSAIMFQIGLTVLVPYVVSTVSSVLTITNMEKHGQG
ncbi:MAG TPA: nitrate/nitrite transporter NrtS [Candidatus Lokiarchaeia archaeon]|nr:nitrate/nitrite transporter NrtS [Candidatus Lokiarchaeia archaeon]